MSENLSGNAIAAAVLADLVKASFVSITNGIAGWARDAWAKVFEDFSPYAENIYRKNTKVRLLCVKDNDVEFDGVYVAAEFRSGDDKASDLELISSIRDGNNIIVMGDGGSGKTFFMRYLWLSLFREPGGLLPIFMELRSLNDLSKADLISYVRATISSKGTLSSDLFDYFCQRGRFALILDGFDELPEGLRNDAQTEILKFEQKYPKCPIVVSTRDDNRFAGWLNFKVFRPLPFDLKRVRQLVDVVPFDRTTKRLFKKEIDAKFFEEHRSFLSNPLLAIMMMMTFKDNMDIPRSLTIFYDQAFNTLFTWHDATKAFSRAKSLDIEQFRRSFSVFCMLSYYDEKYEFSRSDVFDFIGKSNRILGMSIDQDKILRDYVETVNLIRIDGLSYTFVHRSFQEYFSALALGNYLNDRVDSLLPGIVGRWNDSVLKMFFELAPISFTEKFIRPSYVKLIEQLPLPASSPYYCDLFAAVELGYHFEFRDETDDEGRRLPSMTMIMNEETSDFLNSIVRIIADDDRLVYNALFDRESTEFFIVVDGLVDEYSEIIATVDIEFSTNGPRVIVNSSNDHFAELNERQSKLLLDTSREVGLLFEDLCLRVRRWCEERLYETERRRRSIDEIFG